MHHEGPSRSSTLTNSEHLSLSNRTHTTPAPKAKRRLSSESTSEDDDASSSTGSEFVAFPPVPEDHSETRRIEENLQRWGERERQRRKVARETLPSRRPGSSSGPYTGVASDAASVATTSSKWLRIPGRSASHRSSTTSASAMALEPLSRPSTSQPSTEDAPRPTTDPFADPSPAPTSVSRANEDSLSPFSDHNLTVLPKSIKPRPVSRRSTIQQAPPRPLDLPPPRSPPPDTFQDTVPEPVTAPILGSPTNTTSELHSAEPTRWWHEWLCGFGEGPDRGGDIQAGKTNPLE